MKILLWTLALLVTLVQAEETRPKSGCILSQQGDVMVGWRAYKTPAKVGVSGIFKEVVYTPAKKEGKNFKEILTGASVVINTSSVYSKHEGRDVKLASTFFKLLGKETIVAKIVDMTSNKRVKGEPRTGTIMLEVTMNSITKRVPLKYNYDKGVMLGEGVIDIFDFAGSKALTSLNRACFDKHQGKTWSDVNIAFEMNIKAILCAAKH